MSDLWRVDNRPVSVEEMKELEERGVSLGISKLMMMENAGSAIARTALDFARQERIKPGSDGKIRVLAVAGTGNNGGDVTASSRQLVYYSRIFGITVALAGRKEDIRAEEAKTNWNIIERIPEISKIEITDASSVKEDFFGLVSNSELIIVGIFGTGFHGEPREPQSSMIGLINARDKGRTFCLSADIPSGMEADTGISKFAVMSNATVTMHRPKIGMLVSETSRGYCGESMIANIGLPFF